MLPLRRTKRSKGFTLIELLVVIAIIGILSSVVLVSLDQARARARDAQRLSDMRAIRQAIEMFHNDHGHYPGCVDGVSGNGEFIGDDDGQIEQVLAEYLPEVPRDPLHDGTTYFYAYDPQHYVGPEGGSVEYNATVFGFRRAEGPCPECSKDTWHGGHMQLHIAEHNVSLGRGSGCS